MFIIYFLFVGSIAYADSHDTEKNIVAAIKIISGNINFVTFILIHLFFKFW